MRFKDYSGTEQFRPLSAWAYFGYSILFLLPVIGWILLIVFTFSTKNYNRRSFARSYWCGLVLVVIISIVLYASGVGFSWLYGRIPALHQWFPEAKSAITTPVRKTPLVSESKPLAKVTETPKQEPTKESVWLNSGVTPEFKNTMDGYEAFFDSYIDFIDSFDSGNSTFEQLAKYTEMMTKYSKTMEDLNKIDESTLSRADYQYYTEVMLRINHKLASNI